MKSQVSGNGGAALLLTLFVLMFLAIFGATLVVMVFSKMHSATLNLDRLKAFYLAEAGISKALYEIKENLDVDYDGMGSILETKLGEGTYKVEHDIEQKVFISTGKVNENKRVIFIKYETRTE
ncbi:MAG: hypothetical protein V3V42_03435 [Candidatus Omnitrophota bacterium]